MKYYLKVCSGVVVFLAFLLFCHDSSAFAAPIVQTLDKDTRIMPPGFIVAVQSEIPKFRKGTAVTLNMYGEVLEGTLAEDVNLRCEMGASQKAVKPTSYAYTPPLIVTVPYAVDTKPDRILQFKGGTKIAFNNKGEVTKGTIVSVGDNKASIILSPTSRIGVYSGEISFHENGMVASCILTDHSYLRPVGWSQILTENFTNTTACSGFVEFKARKPILLNDKGEVTKGVLQQKTKLRSAEAPEAVKVFEAGTTVEFDDRGLVVKATK
ncbi:hypothetical protein [Acetonema longum]|uniref:Uncharacterized protein n=1 Tax=Acetonema longum DSM 6540 TaxID=1009370 RepID=F7NFI1_9FIRM|nr:hypothetical protein [Acetonema longum]EGO65180.1 hypothetical protein ALO_04041 [Acetonema longum DSM 6540]